MSAFERRLAAVRAAMMERQIDLLFLHPSSSYQYLTGITRDKRGPTDYSQPGDDVRGAYIGVEGQLIVTIPRLPSPRLLAQLPGKPWIQEVRIVESDEDLDAVTRDVVERMGTKGKRVAVDDRAYATSLIHLARALPNAGFVPASAIITPLRAIKDEEEIALLRKASELTDTVLAEVIKFLKPGVDEYQVASEVEYQMMKVGSDGPSMSTGVNLTGAGRNRSIYVRTTNAALRYGDCVSFDFGLLYNGYATDFGRTAFFGEPPAEYVKINEIVMRAQREAIAAMCSGQINGEGADAVARSAIEAEGYGKAFIHRLGHGIGMDIHERPFLERGDRTVLQSGMCFAVEPSICMAHLYCRVEDIVVVRENGGEILSGFNHDLLVAG